MPSPLVKVTRSPQFAGETLLERSVEDAEPAAQILLLGELGLQLGLQLELLGVVALLPLAGRDERPERAALVAVDPVDGLLAALELEDRREQLGPEALLLEPLRHRVHGRDLVLELGIV